MKTAKITNSGMSDNLQMFNMGGIGGFLEILSCLKVGSVYFRLFEN